MRLDSYIQNKDIIVKFIGDLDDSYAEYARSYLDKAIDSNNFTRMIFDFTELNFMDSTGIGVIIGRYKKLKNGNKSLYIKNPSAHIDKIIRTSGIYNIIKKID